MSKPKQVKFRIVTANVGRGVSKAVFRRNIRNLMLRARGAVVCFQEVDEADLPNERRIIGRLMRAGWTFAEPERKVMIAVPRGWRIVKSDSVKACDGYGGVTPERYVVWAIIEHERTGARQAVVNVHYPKLNWVRDDQQRAAWERWFQVQDAVTGITRDLTAGRGLTTWINGDTNNPATRAPVRDCRLVIGDSAIDKQWVAERGVKVRTVATGVIDLTIDGHNGHVSRNILTVP